MGRARTRQGDDMTDWEKQARIDTGSPSIEESKRSIKVTVASTGIFLYILCGFGWVNMTLFFISVLIGGLAGTATYYTLKFVLVDQIHLFAYVVVAVGLVVAILKMLGGTDDKA